MAKRSVSIKGYSTIVARTIHGFPTPVMDFDLLEVLSTIPHRESEHLSKVLTNIGEGNTVEVTITLTETVDRGFLGRTDQDPN